MPVSETIKPSDGVRKKSASNPIDSLGKRRSGRLRDPPEENQSGGDDLLAARMGSSKKPLAKKPANEAVEKKVAEKKPLVTDKVPKKSIQRARGSMALNKTIETEEKKKRTGEVDINNQNNSTVLSDDSVKLKTTRSKTRQPVKPVHPGSGKRMSSAKKKNWATVVKKESSQIVKEDPEDVPAVPETKTGGIQTEGVALSSCSFFEKLQQGVRAYFGSRNSFTDEKPKKKVAEGGIRTGAGVANGGKEEAKARTQEKKIKNKIKNLDRDLFYDRPRLKSNSEGQTNNFLNKKPKILHCVKCKKLYHPKKHYVRIQIPRKGYFYRSFEFRPIRSATGPVNDRLESVSLPTKSEIQIARMAPANSKEPDIHQKRIKKTVESSADEGNDEFSLIHDYLEDINFILNNHVVAHKFENELNRMALDWPVEVSVPEGGLNFRMNEKKSDSEGDKESLDSLNLNRSTVFQKHDGGPYVESAESYSNLETQLLNSSPQYEIPEFKPDSSFNILVSHLKDSLGVGEQFSPIEISPIPMTKGDFEAALGLETGGTDESCGKSQLFQKKDYCVATSLYKYKKENPLSGNRSDEKFAKLLIGDIDLHSELQKYLNESRNVRKIKTENITSIKYDKVLSEGDFESPLYAPIAEAKSEIMKFQTNKGADVKTQQKPDSVVFIQPGDSGSGEKGGFVSHFMSFLFKNSNEQSGAVDYYEGEFPPPTGKNVKTNQEPVSESVVESKPSQSNSQKSEEKTQQNGDVNEPRNPKKWSLNLKELSDIYRFIQKLGVQKNKSKDSSLSLFGTILREKILDKQNKLDLINFARKLKKCFKPPIDWKKGTDQNGEQKLEEWVNMFQEILLSSLTIKQITYLNKVISQLQEQELSTESCDLRSLKGSIKSSSEDEFTSGNETSNSGSELSQKETKIEVPKKQPKPEKTRPSNQKRPISKGKSSSKKVVKPKKTPEKVALSPPADLETILKSDNFRKNTKFVDKILVNVKLCGNRVMVEDFSYLRSEKSLKSTTPTRNTGSELIIENIAGNRLRNASLSDLGQTTSKTTKSSKISGKKKKNIKIVLKSSKSENQSRDKTKVKDDECGKKGKKEQMPSQKNVTVPVKSSKSVQECTKMDRVFADGPSPTEEKKTVFEYDQEQLKVQHPIDAIIETSESKITENADSDENIEDRGKSAPTVSYTRGADVKEALNSVTLERDVVGDLNYRNTKDLGQTRFQVVSRRRDQESLEKINKFLDDWQFRSINGDQNIRKVPVQQNTYFCYPSLVVENKPKKKLKNDSKLVKKTTAKVIKKTSSKMVHRKELVGKNSRTLAFSTQAASSERLARRPERIAKANRARTKQKEKISQSGKASGSKTPNKVGAKNSTGSVLYLSVKGASVSETSSFNASTGSPYPDEVIRPKQRALSETPTSGSSSETAEAFDKSKNGSIMIFSTPNKSDDVSSQFAMIRSDSVLKTLSRDPVSPGKIASALKSGSDLKFYPGRISDSTEDLNPWVTFILTPQQQEEADLPANQVRIVDKRNQTESEKEEAETPAESEIKNEQIPLCGIEKFIDELKESELKIQMQENELENEENESEMSGPVRPKSKRGSRERSASTHAKKNDPQKNKSFPEMRRRGEKKNSGSETVLAKVIVNMLECLLEKKKTRMSESREVSESESYQSDVNSDAFGEYKKWQSIENTAEKMLNAVIEGVTKSERLVRRNKLIVAIRAELEKKAEKPGANVEALMKLSEKLNALKSLRIKVKRKASLSGSPSGEELTKAGVLPRKEEEMKPLGQKASTYFDAEEAKGGSGENVHELEDETGKLLVRTVLEFLGEGETATNHEEKAYTKVELNSPEDDFPRTVSKETEDVIIDKIQENLKANVCHSLALFDSLLMERGTLEEDEKTKNVNQMVNEKSKRLLMELEKNTWMKLYYLLEEVSRLYDAHAEEGTSHSTVHSILNQLRRTVAFNLQLMNAKMSTFQNFLSRSTISDSALVKLFNGLNHIKKTVIPRITSSMMRFFENEALRVISRYEIHAVRGDHNFRAAQSENENQIKFLKNQIRNQRLFIEHLVNSGLGSGSAEISDVKKRVSEKITFLEKSMSSMAADRESPLDSLTNLLSMDRVKSFLTLTKTCRRSQVGSTWNTDA